MMGFSERNSVLRTKLVNHIFLDFTYNYHDKTAVRTILRLMIIVEHIKMVQIPFHDIRTFQGKGSIQNSHANQVNKLMVHT